VLAVRKAWTLTYTFSMSGTSALEAPVVSAASVRFFLYMRARPSQSNAWRCSRQEPVRFTVLQLPRTRGFSPRAGRCFRAWLER